MERMCACACTHNALLGNRPQKMQNSQLHRCSGYHVHTESLTLAINTELHPSFLTPGGTVSSSRQLLWSRFSAVPCHSLASTPLDETLNECPFPEPGNPHHGSKFQELWEDGRQASSPATVFCFHKPLETGRQAALHSARGHQLQS